MSRQLQDERIKALQARIAFLEAWLQACRLRFGAPGVDRAMTGLERFKAIGEAQGGSIRVRNMSFSLTTKQCYDKQKTVTRRLGWANAKPGERIQQVEKAQGLKKGQKVKRIHVIEIVSNRREPLKQLNDDPPYGLCEMAMEGFGNYPAWLWPADFVRMFCKANKCTPDHVVNRIEFKYV